MTKIDLNQEITFFEKFLEKICRIIFFFLPLHRKHKDLQSFFDILKQKNLVSLFFGYYLFKYKKSIYNRNLKK
jgi:hypothetical protein